MIFVDTNYFLRLLVGDVEWQHKQAVGLFNLAAQGKRRLISSVIVFFEVFWVLTSFYGKKKAAVLIILEDLLAMSFVRWEKRKILGAAVAIFAGSNLELEDCYNLAFAKESGVREMRTFDRKLADNWKKR